MSTARQSNQSAGHMAQLEAEREEDFVVTDEPPLLQGDLSGCNIVIIRLFEICCKTTLFL